MVQSLGISVGNSNSYVAAGQGGGIEILLNEYSSRATPSMVAFTDHSRSIGVDAASNFFMNLKNTVYDLILLLGKPYKDLTNDYPFKIEEGSNGEALVVVRHLGEEKKFTITQVLAMLFTKLRGIAGNATDCVISCPQFYNEQQKNSLFQAALIAGLKPLQIISDMSAVVLNYAYYRTSKEDTHKFIAFINLGQSNLQTAVAWFNPREDSVAILASDSEFFGGRDFDRKLAEHFIKKRNLDLNQKQFLKLVNSCEKVKRLLSANTNEIPVHVESLISEECDFTDKIDRATFEEMCQPILAKVEDCFKRTFENAKKTFAQFSTEVAETAKGVEIARAEETTKAVQAAKAAEEAKARRAEIAKSVEAEKAAAAKAKKENAEAAQPDSNDKSTESQESTDAKPDDASNNNEKSSGDKESKPEPMDTEPEELAKAKVAESKAIQAAKTAKSAEKTIASRANELRKLAELKFDLQAVEMIGGSIRVPIIKKLAQEIFNLAPSTTLNTDEAVARGCVLHCATLHPGMRVKREVIIKGSESFFKPEKMTCEADLQRIESDLISADSKYKSLTEARNNLEEFIYSERSKLAENDPLQGQLSEALDWLFDDDGQSTEEDYLNKICDLRRALEAKLVDANGKSN